MPIQDTDLLLVNRSGESYKIEYSDLKNSVNQNLSYTADGQNDGTVEITDGTNAVIPVATSDQAGLFTGTEKDKLDGIEAGAEQNVTYTLPITINDGDDTATIALTDSNGGTDPVNLVAGANISFALAGDSLTISGSDRDTDAQDLGYTADGDNAGTVTITGGDDATIPIATDTVAGLFTGAEKQKLDGLNTNEQNDSRYLRVDTEADAQERVAGEVTFSGGNLTVAPGRLIVQSTESVGVSSSLTAANANNVIRGFQVGSQNGVTAQEIYGYQVSGNLNTNATATTRLAAFHSGVDARGSINYSFYAEGSAPNYMRGHLYVSDDAGFYPGESNAAGGAIHSIASSASSNTPAGAAIRVRATTTNTPYILACWKDSDASQPTGGGIVMDHSTGALSFVNPSDYRFKSDIVDLSGATETIKALKPREYSFRDTPGCVGFVAHELQEVLPKAVSGEKDGTTAIGTLFDWDGTELKTNVAEPEAEELTYTEEVEADGVTQMVTRTRSWSATGSRPKYQGVNEAALIPYLTKALQEALERIEQLEADHAQMMNNNGGY